MHVTTAEDAPRFSLPGVEFTGLASPTRGSKAVCTWRIAVAPGHDSPEPHTLDRDEIFMVTAGRIRLAPGEATLNPGDVAIVPAGTPIQLSNPTPEPAEAYVVIQADFTAAMGDGSTIGTPPWAL